MASSEKRVDLEQGSELQRAKIAARREFLRTAGKAATTVPAVALLLAASAKPTSAQDWYEWSNSWS